MRFDHTFIAIRKRSLLEIYDLAFRVWRFYFLPLMILLFVGALPWLVLNHYISGWMLHTEHLGQFGLPYFFWITFVLIVSQAQVGTAMMSHYLGQAMFIGKPSVWASIKSVWSVGFAYYWLHYGLRMIAITLVLVGAFQPGMNNDFEGLLNFLIFMCLAIGCLVRAFRPYVTKIILLEKAKWRETADNPISFAKRSTALHGGGALNGVGILFSALFIGGLLVVCFLGGIYLVSDLIWLGSSTEDIPYGLFWTLSLWLTAGYFSIVRFLTYIDLRIQQEGWEVELAVRAEAVRLKEGLQ